MKKTLLLASLSLSLCSCTALNGTSVTYKGHTLTYTSAKGALDVQPVSSIAEPTSDSWFVGLTKLFNF